MQRTLCHKNDREIRRDPGEFIAAILQIISLPWRTMEQGERRSEIEAHQ